MKPTLAQHLVVAGYPPVLCQDRPFVIEIDTVYSLKLYFNPLSPHDALRHHFASLKNGLIS